MLINHFGLSLNENKVSAKGYIKHLSSLLHQKKNQWQERIVLSFFLEAIIF